MTVPNVSYNASVLVVLLSVWLMSYVYRFADNILPKSVKFILRPLIAIIVITPLALLILGSFSSASLKRVKVRRHANDSFMDRKL